MKLYLISQQENCGYDTYDSAVVCATNEAQAKNIHPYKTDPFEFIDWTKRQYTWCSSPDKVTVTYIGKATKDTPIGVICASFNAG